MGSIQSFLCENFEIMCDNDAVAHNKRGLRPTRGGTRRLKRVNRRTTRRH